MPKPYCKMQTLRSVSQSLSHGLQTIHSPLALHFSFIVLCLFCSWKILSPPQTPSAVCHTGDFHLLGDTSTSKVLVCSKILQYLVDTLVFPVIWHQAIQYFPIFHTENPEVKISWKCCSFSSFLLNQNLQNATNATAYNGHWRGHLSALPYTELPLKLEKGITSLWQHINLRIVLSSSLWRASFSHGYFSCPRRRFIRKISQQETFASKAVLMHRFLVPWH